MLSLAERRVEVFDKFVEGVEEVSLVLVSVRTRYVFTEFF